MFLTQQPHLSQSYSLRDSEVIKISVRIYATDAAKYGDYWNGEQWAESNDDFYGALARSYRHMRSMMNQGRDLWDPRARNRRDDHVEKWADHHPDADLWGPNDQPPVHGRVAYQ